MSRIALITILVLGSFVAAAAQKAKPDTGVKPTTSDTTAHVRSSSAWAELILRKTEYQAEVESLVLEYTEEFPKVKELRQGVLFINTESERLTTIKPADASKLTLALGKLMVRKVDAELDLWKLQQSYADGHPDVKRAKKKVEIFENAIKEILN